MIYNTPTVSYVHIIFDIDTLWLYDIIQLFLGRDLTSLGFWHIKGPRRDSFPVSWQKTRGSSATSGIASLDSSAETNWFTKTPIILRPHASQWDIEKIADSFTAHWDQISISSNFSGLFKAGSLWWLPWWQKPWKKVDFDLSIHGYHGFESRMQHGATGWNFSIQIWGSQTPTLKRSSIKMGMAESWRLGENLAFRMQNCQQKIGFLMDSWNKTLGLSGDKGQVKYCNATCALLSLPTAKRVCASGGPSCHVVTTTQPTTHRQSPKNSGMSMPEASPLSFAFIWTLTILG